MNPIEKNYQASKAYYQEWGVDTDSALEMMKKVSISLPCWQGDDVGGFEIGGGQISDGGLPAVGNFPGKARNADELRTDLEKVLSLLPGRHRVNLHASYGEFQARNVDRTEIEPRHYKGWVDWAKTKCVKLDFNSTFFSHPKAKTGFTLSHPDAEIRNFWIEHGKRCRTIAAFMGKEQGGTCQHNVWVPDGSKDTPFDRWSFRERLKESLDAVFAKAYPPGQMKDSVESKLFGIGSESYVVGSHEFYLGYGMTRKKMLCLDMGHFHPTESVHDKISSILTFAEELLVHVSRGVRWDSDHVPICNDDMKELTSQIVRHHLENRVHLALDFFDPSINRIGAYTIGARTVLKSFLASYLEPAGLIQSAENQQDYFSRLALFEESRFMPAGAVWDYYCLQENVPAGRMWMWEVKEYEAKELSKRK